MDQQQIIAGRREFDEIDTDHNGFITFDEAIRWGIAQRQGAWEAHEHQIQHDRLDPDISL